MSENEKRGAEQWIVRDPDDKPWGPFASAEEAMEWARAKWPDELADGTCDIEALWKP